AEVMRRAELEEATPFDIPGVPLGHVKGQCSFEAIVEHYGLGRDPGLRRLAQIVHAADVPADDAVAPEGAGLRAIAEGFAQVHGNADHLKLELETPMYDALYAWCSTHVKSEAA
ncbi:MAG: chromate resistance protein ChrB domain-containing protein, partial [Candidatus Eiseniibacteriota bacterium]